MKRFISSLAIASYIITAGSLSFLHLNQRVSAQLRTDSSLYYTFYGQKIPLSLRSDTVAVAFKPVRTRGQKSVFQRLQDDLGGINSSTRSGSGNSGIKVEVNPLGTNFALVKLSTTTRSSGSIRDLQQRIQKQSYVKETLPVLNRTLKSSANSQGNNSQSKAVQQTIVLPNEIVIKFELSLSDSQIKLLLAKNNLEIIRKLRFTKSHYLVRSKYESGIKILSVANQLGNIPGIGSATPNFIQSTSFQNLIANSSINSLTETPNSQSKLNNILASLPQPKNTPRKTSLLPLQWHLNSTPRRGRFLPRIDVRATEAWNKTKKKSKNKKPVVVAVIDSIIQWDHPELKANLYNPENLKDRLPNEKYGWDFSSSGNGDADTRIDANELGVLRDSFQSTFKLSTPDILKKYSSLARFFRRRFSKASNGKIAIYIKNYIRNRTSAEFHGTWSAGVISANSQDGSGILGVAPNSKILPVRVFGLGGRVDPASLIEAIGYSNARGADIINMSLGGLIPHEGIAEQVFDVLDSNPKLVMVASAGNNNLDRVSYPTAIPGVISVGATNMTGHRTFYSSYGSGLDVVAPGGEVKKFASGGILTTGGTFKPGFWQGINVPKYSWGLSLDSMGKYVQVQGTSFSAPIASGVVALMKSKDKRGKLNRKDIIQIIRSTASHESLSISKADRNRYRLKAGKGIKTRNFPSQRSSGLFQTKQPVSAEQYYFGNGLINAEAAVSKVK